MADYRVNLTFMGVIKQNHLFIFCLTSQTPKSLFIPEFLLRLIGCDLRERQNVALFEFHTLECIIYMEDLKDYVLCRFNF
jgi:hypothetical protein